MLIRKIRSAIRHIVNEIYSMYFNIKVLPLKKALKFPLYVNYKVKIHKSYKGCIEIEGALSRHMIKIGSIGAPFIPKANSSFYCKPGAKLIFEGRANLAEGVNLFIENGTIKIGDNSYIGCNTIMQCQSSITIGKDFLGGWNLCIRDTDGHTILCDDIALKMSEGVFVGEHVWVAADCTILKGSYITSGSIIGCHSLVCGIKMIEENCLIAGSPAKVIKKNVVWVE